MAYEININNIIIILDEKIKNSRKLSFCLYNIKFLNPEKNKFEQFIIFASKFYLQFLGKTNHIFVESTFKVVRKKFLSDIKYIISQRK